MLTSRSTVTPQAAHISGALCTRLGALIVGIYGLFISRCGVAAPPKLPFLALLIVTPLSGVLLEYIA